MKTAFSYIDVTTCSREECEAMLQHLRGCFLPGGEEKRKLEGQISSFQKRLTLFRIDNIKSMIRG
jgi:CTP synthase (UTP-ammonia lyase)